MAKNGFKIFDSDTHVGPIMQVLDKYLTEAERKKLAASWEPYKETNTKRDDHYKDCVSYSRDARTYRRVLGTASADDNKKGPGARTPSVGGMQTPSTLLGDSDPAYRIKDLEVEGVDVNLMLPSGWFGAFTTTDDVALEMGMYRAYHRWLNDYCSAYPDRLGAVMLAGARDVAGTVEEIKRWSKSRWAWAIQPLQPYGMPLDHPALEPIWAAAQEYDFGITLHVQTSAPPYSPGGQDTWGNRFLQGSASHPWCGMRDMAALIANGIMDRYPKLRIATLEAGHGWLPYWMAQIDEHAKVDSGAIANIKHKPSDYVKSGRYFQSLEIHEGEKLTNAVCDEIGDDVLMYASDYPHSECRFPKSVESVMAWNMPQTRKRKLLWDNAVKFYARSGLK